MNPPFSVLANVAGKARGAAMRHIVSALARLEPGGRLVAITGAGCAPDAPAWRDAFDRLQQTARVVFSAAIDGRVYAPHGTLAPTRLASMKPTSKPKPVNNARDDKLRSPMWRRWFETPAQRCLIPFTAFAEAEGEKGRMTRTWIAVGDQPLAAWAGLWRPTDEWGDCFTGVMVDATEELFHIHDRMPVILEAGARPVHSAKCLFS